MKQTAVTNQQIPLHVGHTVSEVQWWVHVRLPTHIKQTVNLVNTNITTETFTLESLLSHCIPI